jgi:hypothetical protein
MRCGNVSHFPRLPRYFEPLSKLPANGYVRQAGCPAMASGGSFRPLACKHARNIAAALPASAACEFVMDALTTRAPFWKRDETANGERWVDARRSDNAAAVRWPDS